MLTKEEQESNTRILVVDDDDVDREKISRCLHKAIIPITILDATSGEDALDQTLTEDIDLIILDYNLGDMTGVEFLTRIKKNNIPTIMITGAGSENSAIEAMKLGAVDYLTKDTLTEKVLLPVLTAAIKKNELQRKYEKSQEELKRKSLYDSLTGLSNRDLIFDRLEQSILSSDRHSINFYLLVIDLNSFKEVNDSFGHLAGDEVLKKISERMLSASRKSDTVGRFGGDEFVLILPEVESIPSLMVILNKLMAAIAKPISVGKNILTIGASIGIAHYPIHGKDVETLLSNADYAMYQAKKNNQNYVFYDEKYVENANQNINTQSILKALEEHEFIIEYQPKIDVLTNMLVSAEALVRWQSPSYGIIMPANFIPFSERSNLIGLITDEVIFLALEQAKEWSEKGCFDFDLALNISARMLDTPSFQKNITDAVLSRNLNPNNIILEITETALASSRQNAQTLLSSLIEEGFQISIDDFGSGFTSFLYIRDIEFSEIKIDQLFVSAIHTGSRDMQIVNSIISLANSLGIRTVAEGVETEEQKELLSNAGCNCLQGFGIAKPMSAEQLVSWQISNCKIYKDSPNFHQ